MRQHRIVPAYRRGALPHKFHEIVDSGERRGIAGGHQSDRKSDRPQRTQAPETGAGILSEQSEMLKLQFAARSPAVIQEILYGGFSRGRGHACNGVPINESNETVQRLLIPRAADKIGSTDAYDLTLEFEASEITSGKSTERQRANIDGESAKLPDIFGARDSAWTQLFESCRGSASRYGCRRKLSLSVALARLRLMLCAETRRPAAGQTTILSPQVWFYAGQRNALGPVMYL
jgi:hypothetical protein